MMDRQRKKIIELLTNADFRKWATAPTKEQDTYWYKWLDSHTEYCDAMVKAKELIIRFRFRQEILSDTEQEVILDKIIAAPRNFKKHSQELVHWIKVAAVITIFISVGFLFYRDFNGFANLKPEVLAQQNTVIEKRNPQGIKSQFVLPDGTRVYLNSESKLVFPEQFSDTARTVQLTGEAFFEVAQDTLKPFAVQSKNIVITALGTSFNVRAFPDDEDVNVVLVTGRILVKSENRLGNNYMLNPGEMIVLGLQHDHVYVSNFNILSEIGWKDGILMFENAGFDEFVQKIERWYGVKVKVSGKPEKKWNIDGHFNNESLEEILTGVSFTHDINYKINQKEVELKYK
jgi:transmembrane sensor